APRAHRLAAPREPDREGRPLPWRAGAADAAAEHVDVAADDVEADAAAVVRAAVGGLAVEVEDVGQIVGGDAAAGVGDGDADAIAGGVARGADLDPACLRELAGVADQVADHLTELPAIRHECRQVRIDDPVLLDPSARPGLRPRGWAEGAPQLVE